jgi:molybdopterin converting factor small subunit
VKVRVPTPLRSYTGQHANVVADGDTLAAVLDDLDRRYPGLLFRIVDEQRQLRQHMSIFVRGERTRDLSMSLDGVEEVVIMQALSGGA